MKKIKKIQVVSGTRADYGIYYPLLEKIMNDDVFELEVIATGMHLSPQYGLTINEILKDGFPISSKVDMLLHGATESNMARSIGIGILGFTQEFERNRPDLLIVLGDRGEMLAAVIAAAHQNIPVAHLHGGEVSGSIDESVRHAITKFSHIHFAATKKSAERLIKMGEDSWRVYQVGAPRLDTILNEQLPPIEDVFFKYQLGSIGNDYYLLVFHPVSTEVDTVTKQIENVLEALLTEGKPIICILPNSDAGNDRILNVYKKYEGMNNISFVTNFSHKDYLTVLKNCSAMVGNSSSGIIEAASFSIPVLNIGTRQNGRERSDNTYDVGVDRNEIVKGLEVINSKKFRSRLSHVRNVYGEGNASQKIIDIIKKITVDDNLIAKRICY